MRQAWQLATGQETRRSYRRSPLIIERREGESNERLIARFRQMVQRAGILREARRRRHFVSNSEAQRIAHAKTARRARRAAERAEWQPGAR